LKCEKDIFHGFEWLLTRQSKSPQAQGTCTTIHFFHETIFCINSFESFLKTLGGRPPFPHPPGKNNARCGGRGVERSLRWGFLLGGNIDLFPIGFPIRSLHIIFPLWNHYEFVGAHIVPYGNSYRNLTFKSTMYRRQYEFVGAHIVLESILGKTLLENLKFENFCAFSLFVQTLQFFFLIELKKSLWFVQ
jgi:hypothetical protein